MIHGGNQHGLRSIRADSIRLLQYGNGTYMVCEGLNGENSRWWPKWIGKKSRTTVSGLGRFRVDLKKYKKWEKKTSLIGTGFRSPTRPGVFYDTQRFHYTRKQGELQDDCRQIFPIFIKVVKNAIRSVCWDIFISCHISDTCNILPVQKSVKKWIVMFK